MKKLILNLRGIFFFQLFTIYLRYLIGGAYVFASIVKIQSKRFTFEYEISEINSSTHLFETLYQSGIYWNFIGWSQLVCGFLLLTQKQSFLGAIVSLPIALNIFFITLSYPDFIGTLKITSLMLLAIIYLILWEYDKASVIFSTKSIIEITDIEFSKKKIWGLLGVFYFLIVILTKLYATSFIEIVFACVASLIIGVIVFILQYIKHG